MIATGPGVAGLADGDDVDRGVQLPVARPGQPVAADVSAGRLDRRGAAVAGVVVPAGEAGHVAAVGDDLRGQDGAEPSDLGQVSAYDLMCRSAYDLTCRSSGELLSSLSEC